MSTDFLAKKCIYALTDPLSNRVMYVGKTIDMDYRYRQHCDIHSPTKNLLLAIWIANLSKQDKKPKLIILEECDESTVTELNAAEEKWIREYKIKGEADYNIVVGERVVKGSKIKNTHPDDWLEFATNAKYALLLLHQIGEQSGNMAHVKYLDAIIKIIRSLEKQIRNIENDIYKEYPEWKHVSQALRSVLNES